ncbi:MAG: AbrB/MazE/SpoVT family DNA-binding domain-containing protein [Chloroflexi bacterium]|nr:AbrB/MazE/SpoVT family DNA-binding domain-containing protein [Chloroflexota bacterium]
MRLRNTDHRRADDNHVQTLTVSSKGQITISADARRKLSIDKGTRLLEIVVGDCLMYVPEHAYVNQIFESLQERLRRASITTEDLLADMEAHKDDTFREFYPNLAGE